MLDTVTKINTEVLTGRARVKVTSGYRSYEEQDKLYAKGRTAPGPKVTNAKAGHSMHNFGLAFDICLELDGKIISWDVNKDFDEDRQSDWMEVVKVFKDLGFKWGGDWKTFKDMPHFEVDFPLATLRHLYKLNTFIEDTEYVSLHDYIVTQGAMGINEITLPKGVQILV